MSVRKKMAHGALWVLSEKIGQQVLNFVIFLIVARLIGPEEFGLASLCAVFSALAVFVGFGAADAVISQRLSDDRRLSTLFWAVLTIGAVLSIATFSGAGLFARLMDDVRLADLLRWLAVLPVLIAASAVPTLIVQARMDFKIFTIRSLVSTILSGVLGIYLAVEGYGAYALVYRQIAQLVIINFIIWPGAGWFPKWIFDRSILGSVLGPGFRMIGSTLITFVEQQAPPVLIGLFLGPIYVGYFAFVSRIFISLRETLVLPLTTVLYPALAHIRDNQEDVRRMIGQIVLLTGFLILPALAGAAVTAPQYVPLFFGDKWTVAVPVLQLYLVAMLPGPFLLIIRELLRAHGKTGAFVRIQSMIAGVNVLVVYFLVERGLVVMAAGLIVSAFAMFPAGLWVLKRLAGFNLGPDFLRLWAPVIGAIAMIAAIETTQRAGLHPQNPWLNLGTSLVLGTAVYVAVCGVLQFRQISTLAASIRTLAKRPKSGSPPETPA